LSDPTAIIAYIIVEREIKNVIDLGSFNNKESLLSKAIRRIDEKYKGRPFSKADVYSLGKDTEVSKRREETDAKTIFKSGKKKTEFNPSFVITDSLKTYEPAFRKEFNVRKTAHVKTKSIQDGFANRPIERYHNEVRAILKTKRGLGNDTSAQEFADAQRIHHNFCRPHTGLPNGITPAQASGIDLDLGVNKIKALIEKSAEAKQESRSDHNIEVQLGKRVEHVNIFRERDCISVKSKTRIGKPVWKEINDILTVNGFAWLENGKESEWIKMKQRGSSAVTNEERRQNAKQDQQSY
jgi:hypothetical protein